ncbi:MAG: hypothetical protein M3Q13_04540 [Pseudomonadota bacterium]|nr:hypothetical protein [Pseudomonadota bacterium]
MKFLAIAAGAALVTCMAGAAAQGKGPAKKLYCWSENGRKVCGDTLPPEAVNRARTEINSRSGMRSGQIDRTLTPEERAARDAEAKRLEAEAQTKAMLERRDIALADSYETEADLKRAYRIRYELVDESMKSSQLALGNLRQSLLRLLDQASEHELKDEKIPKMLADNIGLQRREFVSLQSGYRKQRQDRASIDAELQTAVARYRAMKAPDVPNASPQDDTDSNG